MFSIPTSDVYMHVAVLNVPCLRPDRLCWVCLLTLRHMLFLLTRYFFSFPPPRHGMFLSFSLLLLLLLLLLVPAHPQEHRRRFLSP